MVGQFQVRDDTFATPPSDFRVLQRQTPQLLLAYQSNLASALKDPRRKETLVVSAEAAWERVVGSVWSGQVLLCQTPGACPDSCAAHQMHHLKPDFLMIDIPKTALVCIKALLQEQRSNKTFSVSSGTICPS